MAMMRRGPLDRYPVEWVLRQAASSGANGCIEFHGPVPITVFLDGGRIAAAARGISSEGDEAIAAARLDDDEAEARTKAVAIIALGLQGDGGWYYHDPLEHRGSGGWRWDVASLLMEARVHSHGERTLTEWADKRVALQVPSRTDVRLGADAWAVVVELAGEARALELRTRLGWDTTRLVGALEELVRSGALHLRGPKATPPAESVVVRPRPAAHRPAPRQPLFDDEGATRAANAADIAAAVLAAETVLADAALATSGDEVVPDGGPGGPDGHHRGPLTPPPTLRVVDGGRPSRRRALGGRRSR